MHTRIMLFCLYFSSMQPIATPTSFLRSAPNKGNNWIIWWPDKELTCLHCSLFPKRDYCFDEVKNILYDSHPHFRSWCFIKPNIHTATQSSSHSSWVQWTVTKDNYADSSLWKPLYSVFLRLSFIRIVGMKLPLLCLLAFSMVRFTFTLLSSHQSVLPTDLVGLQDE